MFEQFVIYYSWLAEREENLQNAGEFLNEARSHLDNSQVLFERIQRGNFSERLESLRNSLRQAARLLSEKSEQQPRVEDH